MKKGEVVVPLFLLIFSFVVFFIFNEVSRIKKSFNDFYYHPNLVRLSSNRLRIQLEIIQKNLLLAVLRPQEADLYAENAEIASIKVYAEFEAMRSAVKFADMSKLDDLQNKIELLEKNRKLFFALLDENKISEAAEIFKTVYEKEALRTVELYQYFIDFSEKKGEEFLAVLNKDLLKLPLTLLFSSMLVLTLFAAAIFFEQIENVRKLQTIAFFDKLTGLPNEIKFADDMRQMLINIVKSEYVVIKFDIENFKIINELFSEETGNLVLKTITAAVQKLVHEKRLDLPLFCRSVKDEFLLAGFDETVESTDTFLRSLERYLNCELQQVLKKHYLRLKFGRYFFDASEKEVKTIIENVNLVHSLAKKTNKRICDYDSKIKEKTINETKFVNHMEYALEAQEFKMFLQPKYSLKTDEIVGAEALVRWVQEDGTIILPADFIPLFEKNGSLVQLDFYMLENACRKIRSWIDNGISPVPISVNFSRLHLNNPLFAQMVCDITQSHTIAPSLIEIELTEPIIYDKEQSVVTVFDDLHKRGFAVSMDDFGTDYSSLGMLKNTAVDTVKMDKSFVTNFETENARLIVESVIDMTKKTHMETVAEGIETKEQVSLIKKINCDVAQGYFYAKPMCEKDFDRFVMKKNGDVYSGGIIYEKH